MRVSSTAVALQSAATAARVELSVVMKYSLKRLVSFEVASAAALVVSSIGREHLAVAQGGLDGG
jgi:hypothetical protein